VNKPYHTPEAFRRFIQMSSTGIFVFVEGQDTDAFFYAELCRPVCDSYHIAYEIVRADRISSSGGKDALIKCHGYFATAGSLIERSRPTAACCIFFLDKDVDDVLHKLVKSPHIVYTPFYNVENALYLFGDIVRAAAAASSLDAARLSIRIPDPAVWRRQSARRWIEFVVFCLFSYKYRVPCDCTYKRSASPLNHTPDSAPNPADVAAKENELNVLSGLATQVFKRKLGAVRRLVEHIYQSDRHDLVFNGKWYRALLRREVELAAAGETYNAHGVVNGMSAALCATVDFSGDWVDHFRTPLRTLIEQL
jgi:hypothetical protein